MFVETLWKKDEMMKHVRVHALLLVFAFGISCKQQNKTDLPKDDIKSKTNEVITFRDITRLPKIGTKHAKVNKTQPTGNGLAENVHCGLQDKNGNLWFGTTGHGVFCYDGRSFTNFTVIDGLNSNHVSSIIEDNKGNIWIGTSQGVTLYDGKSFTNFTKHASFGKNPIISLLQDKNGRIWIGTMDNGTYFWDENSFARLTSVDGIPNANSLTLSMVMSMTEDKAGNLWFASRAGEGLSSFDGQTMTN